MNQVPEKKEKTNDRSRANFEIILEDHQIDIENRTVDLSITSEIPVKRWWGMMALGHNPGECRLDRLKTVGSFLFAHGRDPIYGTVPIGSILEIYLDETNRKYRAKVKFDTDEKSEVLWQKVQSGSLRGISVGTNFHAWLEIEEGSEMRGFKGPMSIAVDWEPFEISLEPTPALPNVGVGLSNEIEEKGEEFEMSKPAEKQVKEPTKEDLENQPDNSIERFLQIDEICQRFEIDNEQKKTFIKENYSIEQVNKFVIDKLSKEKPVATGSVTIDESEKFAAAAIDGLSIRAGVRVEKPAQGASDFRGMSLARLAEECYEHRTGKHFRGSTEDLMRAVMPVPGELVTFSAAASHSNFPLILANVANKSMAKSYEEAATTYQNWVSFGTLPDFKDSSRVKLSEASGLKPIGSHGEIEHSETTEDGTTVKLGTYAIGWSLTRTMIINDDLSAFNKLPAAYAQAARRDINRMVYEALNNNAAMRDNKALFHADHKNLAATAGAVNDATLEAAYEAMALQTGIKGEAYLNITPKYILVPTGKDVAVMRLISSPIDPEAKLPGVPNPFQGRLIIISDPMLRFGKGGSATAWYLVADSNQVDTIEVDFLNGKDVPTMESQVSFDMLGIQYRMYHDWGVKAIDYRGLYKNAGA